MHNGSFLWAFAATTQQHQPFYADEDRQVVSLLPFHIYSLCHQLTVMQQYKLNHSLELFCASDCLKGLWQTFHTDTHVYIYFEFIINWSLAIYWKQKLHLRQSLRNDYIFRTTTPTDNSFQCKSIKYIWGWIFNFAHFY